MRERMRFVVGQLLRQASGANTSFFSRLCYFLNVVLTRVLLAYNTNRLWRLRRADIHYMRHSIKQFKFNSMLRRRRKIKGSP